MQVFTAEQSRWIISNKIKGKNIDAVVAGVQSYSFWSVAAAAASFSAVSCCLAVGFLVTLSLRSSHVEVFNLFSRKHRFRRLAGFHLLQFTPELGENQPPLAFPLPPFSVRSGEP